LDLVVLPTSNLECFNSTDNSSLCDLETGNYDPHVHSTAIHTNFQRYMPVTVCRRADNFPDTKLADDADLGDVAEWKNITTEVTTLCETYNVRVEDRTALLCDCEAMTSQPPPPKKIVPSLQPVGDFYLPKFTGGFIVVRPSSTLRFGKGSCTIESSFLMGTGVVEFTGGQHHLLTTEVDAEIRVNGGALVVESPFFQMSDANTRETAYHAMERNRFSVLDGFVNFTAVAPHFTVNGNMLLAGGYLWMRSQSTLTAEYKKQRGMVRVVNRFEWNGGTMDGNADLRNGGGMAIGGTTKYLKNSWAVINFAEAYWHTGDIVNTPGSNFVNKGTLEMQDNAVVPRQQIAGVDEDSRHKGPSAYLHTWSRF